METKAQRRQLDPSQRYFARLQLVQITAARLLTNKEVEAHCTLVLASLHWLLVYFGSYLKFILFTFKTISDLVQSAFMSFCTPTHPAALSG